MIIITTATRIYCTKNILLKKRDRRNDKYPNCEFFLIVSWIRQYFVTEYLPLLSFTFYIS